MLRQQVFCLTLVQNKKSQLPYAIYSNAFEYILYIVASSDHYVKSELPT